MEHPIDTPLKQFTHLSQGHFLRGFLINEFSGLEKSLERYIGIYVLGESGDLDRLINIILDRLTFEAKRTAFKTIRNNIAIENGFVKNKSNKYPDSDLIHEIRRINDHRIYFAHFMIVMPDINSDKVISLVEFRDSTKIISYTEDEYNKLIADIKNAYDAIESMTTELLSN